MSLRPVCVRIIKVHLGVVAGSKEQNLALARIPTKSLEPCLPESAWVHSAEVRSSVASFGSRLAVYRLELPSANLGEISLEEEVEQSSNHCDDREAHQLVPARSD